MVVGRFLMAYSTMILMYYSKHDHDAMILIHDYLNLDNYGKNNEVEIEKRCAIIEFSVISLH